MNSESAPPVAEAYAAIAEYGLSLGVGKLCDIDGCWEQQIDDLWWVAANGHREPMKCSTGAEIPPFHFYLQFNGWPAGLIGPYGGDLIAVYGEDESAEDKLIEAVRTATKEGKG